MEQYIVKILSKETITHDVNRYRIEKPDGYKFIPGQATEVSINKQGLQDERRPFTFTSLNDWDFLEFTIKSYNDHDGVTKKLALLNPGDELIIHDVWGTINYKGKGIFIAGGAGVTPFIAILRDLYSKNEIAGNKLLFANKTRNDIILEAEFSMILGKNFINILSNEKREGYLHGYINAETIKRFLDPDYFIYLCGPEPMMEAIEKHLKNLNVDSSLIVKEEF